MAYFYTILASLFFGLFSLLVNMLPAGYPLSELSYIRGFMGMGSLYLASKLNGYNIYAENSRVQ